MSFFPSEMDERNEARGRGEEDVEEGSLARCFRIRLRVFSDTCAESPAFVVVVPVAAGVLCGASVVDGDLLRFFALGSSVPFVSAAGAEAEAEAEAVTVTGAEGTGAASSASPFGRFEFALEPVPPLSPFFFFFFFSPSAEEGTPSPPAAKVDTGAEAKAGRGATTGAGAAGSSLGTGVEPHDLIPPSGIDLFSPVAAYFCPNGLGAGG